MDSLGRAPNLILFSDVHGDIVTNLLPGHGVSALTDSDNNPNNGRDGRVLLPTDIGSITLRTITAADIDTTIPGNTVANRLALTSFSIYGNIYCGGNFGGLTIDTSGDAALATKFNGVRRASSCYERRDAPGRRHRDGQRGQRPGVPFHAERLEQRRRRRSSRSLKRPGQHGGDISNIMAASTGTIFSIGELATGDGRRRGRGAATFPTSSCTATRAATS